MSKMIPELNAGSSSLKCSLFATANGKDVLSPSILLDEPSYDVPILAADLRCSSRLN
jgi:hypothetical protein